MVVRLKRTDNHTFVSYFSHFMFVSCLYPSQAPKFCFCTLALTCMSIWPGLNCLITWLKITFCFFSPGSLPHDDKPHDLIISGSKDHTVRVWEMVRWGCVHTLYGHTHWVTSVAVEGNIVISGSDDNSARIWDVSKVSYSENRQGYYVNHLCL